MRADRLISIMLLLQANGKMTARQLAVRLEVSRRTILRDVEALTIAGIPVITEEGYGGGIYLDEAYRFSLNGLNVDEVRALFIGSSRGPLAHLGLHNAIAQTLLKLFSSLSPLQRQTVQQIRNSYYVDPLWWGHEQDATPDFFRLLEQAIRENNIVSAIYENGKGEIGERLLEPYGLVSKGNVWYLVARRLEEFRAYRVDRFRAVAIMDKRFERVTPFDLAAYWQATTSQLEIPFVDCTLVMPASRLQFLKWIGNGRFTLLDESPVQETVRIRLRARSLDVARMLVMGIGPGTTVIEPPELKKAVDDAIAVMQLERSEQCMESDAGC